MRWQEAARYLKDCLFPVFCVQCGQEGDWWCRQCLAQAKIILRIDQKVVPDLDCLATFFIYDEFGASGKLIQQFKYQFLSDIKNVWRQVVEDNSERLKNILSATQIFIPVPLHKKRELERGFNQARIIAEIIFQRAGGADAVLSSNLKRTRATKQQAKLSAVERYINIKEAFNWQGENLSGKNVAIFDDVFTTGATMQECARILKANGAKQVIGLALARG